MAAGIGLAFLWCIPALIVGFEGEIALNDDFAYAWAVRTLVEQGAFERLPVTWVPVLVTTYWGALFSWFGGFSFAALRLSSWVAGGLGIWATHRLLRECDVPRGGAFLGAALLAVNPVYVNLAFTFMTDIAFMALTTAALAAFLRNLRTGSLLALAVGTMFAIAAVLTRQVGFAAPMAFALALLIATQQRFRLLKGIGVCVAVAIPFVAFLAIQSAAGGAEVYSASDLGRQMGSTSAIWFAARHTLQAIVLLGAFLAPLLVWFRPPGRSWLWFAGGVVVVASGLEFFDLSPMPWKNIIRTTGLGVHGLRGEDVLPQLPSTVRWAITLFTSGTVGVGAGALLGWLLGSPGEKFRDPRLWLMLAFGGASLAPYLTRSPFFDRYALAVLPAAAALFFLSRHGGYEPASESRDGAAFKWKVGFSAAVVLAIGWFATAGTYGSMQVARTQLAILEQLHADGVTTAEIDGGRAWNAWQYDWVNMPRLSGEKRYFVVDDEWVLSFEDTLEGYRRVSTVSHDQGLRWQDGEIHVHQRVASVSADPRP
jgi:hypothetical protein